MVALKVLAVLFLIQVAAASEKFDALSSWFPFFVYVANYIEGTAQVSVCGGSLIEENFVVTTASCVLQNSRSRSVHLREPWGCTADNPFSAVSDAIIHENYTINGVTNPKYDIAILKLTNKMKRDECSRFAIIPKYHDNVIKKKKSFVPYLGSRSLYFFETHIIHSEIYKKSLNSNNKYTVLYESQFRIESTKSIENFKISRPGFPLVQKHNDKILLIGLSTEDKDVFILLSFFADWIEGKINDVAITENQKLSNDRTFTKKLSGTVKQYVGFGNDNNSHRKT
ncbi:plasma kallikrein [Copidosoma floridanum]|uniref:plasma kallikrein n=1 Tax=Copidosoma floridanum TaxID=29053 RepID=UPI0006C97F89|nr:plasma kallikrein [Copidosoma floridanum]